MEWNGEMNGEKGKDLTKARLSKSGGSKYSKSLSNSSEGSVWSDSVGGDMELREVQQSGQPCRLTLFNMTHSNGSEYPKTIDLSQPRYPQNTYYGRLRHFSDLTNPRNLLVTPAQLNDSKSLLARYTNQYTSTTTTTTVHSAEEEERLWRAKRVVDSTVHPDTGEPIFLPFRMSSFVPTNLVVVAGVLRPNPTVSRLSYLLPYPILALPHHLPDSLLCSPRPAPLANSPQKSSFGNGSTKQSTWASTTSTPTKQPP